MKTLPLCYDRRLRVFPQSCLSISFHFPSNSASLPVTTYLAHFISSLIRFMSSMFFPLFPIREKLYLPHKEQLKCKALPNFLKMSYYFFLWSLLPFVYIFLK